MATATQIAERALKRLSLVQAGDSPAATDVTDAKDALGAMIASWEGKGLSGDVLPIDARFEKPVVDMLAVEIAPMFGLEPSAQLVRDALDGWDTIQAAFFAVPATQFESGLAYTGHFSQAGNILGEATGLFGAWQASTDYVARQYVVNASNVYECVTGGTSASSGGPTTQASEITDGTCVWCWRRVAGL